MRDRFSVAGDVTGAIDTMVELCARLPLTLRIAAELLPTTPRNW